jgi:AcrR family transcriptional regulator
LQGRRFGFRGGKVEDPDRQAASGSTAEAVESIPDRIIRVARELINETGDFNLSMRELAARARVSLRTPYQHFGSKGGIITEILHRDQAQYAPMRPRATDAQLVDAFFEVLEASIPFIGARQSFYRALFRASGAYSGGRESEPARENQRGLTLWCRRASRTGLLRPEINPDIAAEALTNIIAAEWRHWANSEFDIALAGLRMGFGFAALLGGLGSPELAEQMRERTAQYQAALEQYEDPSGVVASGVLERQGSSTPNRGRRDAQLAREG